MSDIIELRDISKGQAKDEIRHLLASDDIELDYGDIANELRLELRLVVGVCKELIDEGIIEFT